MNLARDSRNCRPRCADHDLGDVRSAGRGRAAGRSVQPSGDRGVCGGRRAHRGRGDLRGAGVRDDGTHARVWRPARPRCTAGARCCDGTAAGDPLGVTGGLCGLAAASVVSRVLGSALYLVPQQHPGLLYGVRTRDPLTLASAFLLIVLVAAAAGFVPARRVGRIDPMLALRESAGVRSLDRAKRVSGRTSCVAETAIWHYLARFADLTPLRAICRPDPYLKLPPSIQPFRPLEFGYPVPPLKAAFDQFP